MRQVCRRTNDLQGLLAFYGTNAEDQIVWIPPYIEIANTISTNPAYAKARYEESIINGKAVGQFKNLIAQEERDKNTS